MAIKVKILERSFITQEVQPFWKIYPTADKFEILIDNEQRVAHLQIFNGAELVAFFPNGTYMGVERILEVK